MTDASARTDGRETIRDIAVPVLFSAVCLLIGLFFKRPGMGDPDSYREALSAFRYIQEGVYSSYWDFALTMRFFVAGTRLASALDIDQLAMLNGIAVALTATSAWPLYQLIRRLVNWQTATCATVAYVTSPTLIRYSTYLSHEVVGFVFALWSVYVFERMLARRSRLIALAFGLVFGGAWAARTNGAVFIVPALLVFFLHERNRFKAADVGRFLEFALLGFGACLLLVHRPETLLRLFTRFSGAYGTYYHFGRFIGRTSGTAIESLTPALVMATLAGLASLIVFRGFFGAIFGSAWILTVYLFYAGMDVCRLRYFLVVLPPCLLLTFAGADRIDAWIRLKFKRGSHVVKLAVIVLLLVVSLRPSLPDLLYIRKANDDKILAETIGSVVDGELLFVTSMEPMIQYYNRGHPPETAYAVDQIDPYTFSINAKAFRLAQQRLSEGRPVFVMDIVIPHLQRVGAEMDYDLVCEYKSVRVFRLTRLESPRRGSGG